MGEWLPIYISFLLLIIIGGIVPAVITPFIDLNEPVDSLLLSPLINFMTDGLDVPILSSFWGFLGFDNIFNPFAWFGSTFQEYMVNHVIAFSYIPNWISIPILIFILLGFLYGFIKLARG